MRPDESNMVHDAIPHYLKSGNCNNSANTSKEEENTPTLQVNSKSRPIRSISSGNLAKKMSFKSFKDIQQSQKRSRTNSRETFEIDGGNPGLSTDPNFSSNPSDSEAIIQQFNDKTKEITKTMANLHFSTIDLRNKISQGCITNINPNYHSGNKELSKPRSRTSEGGHIPPCSDMLEGNKGFSPQGDEFENQVSIL